MTTAQVTGRSTASFETLGTARIVSVPEFSIKHGIRPETLPRSIRIILEAALRASATGLAAKELPLGILRGRAGDSTIAFPVGRVLLQDAAGLPLLADLAAFRDAVVRAGLPADTVRPRVPVAMVVDHSVQSHHYGSSAAFEKNLAAEFEQNAERYVFVKWAQQAFPGLTVVPPGNGIVHQVHLESLAEIVSVRDGWVFCDTVIGTDSHTPMVNGLGVLGWGVGGIEAEAALLGDLQDLSRPEVIGVELHGSPGPGTLAADIALTLTQRLRAENVVGAFLEFFGDGLDHLSVADRCTIANMAPEYGATLALFPTDEDVLQWLADRGRPRSAIELIRTYLSSQGLFGRGQPELIEYDRRICIDLSDVVPCVAGPTRPDERVSLSELATTVPKTGGVFDARVLLAAITSCTNTANPESMITAGLLALNARKLGLTVDRQIKTVLAPGSRAVSGYLADVGLLEPLAELGFVVAAYGCAVCVGNSGGLAPGLEERLARDGGQAIAVLSGNRNFEARIHPAIRSAYLMNPALVVAFALAGRVDIDLLKDPLARTAQGADIYLADLWPSSEQVKALARKAGGRQAELVSPAAWKNLPACRGAQFPWSSSSTYFVPPPFFEAPADSALVDVVAARPLLVLGDAVTTDHISPVGKIGSKSVAADYLRELGVHEKDFNTYAARRANHHVMVRGTFANERLKNLLLDGKEGSFTLHQPSGQIDRIFTVAERYRGESVPLVIVAGERYGTGSARDWAAKGTALLGVRAVIAASFERIHRSNLVRLGVLPVQLSASADARRLGEQLRGCTDAQIDIKFRGEPVRPHPRCGVYLRVAGKVENYDAVVRIDTAAELDLLKAGDLFRFSIARWMTSNGK
ncbi:MAG: aconitate hydratase AcnA [Pseudorhodoplanes sp.]|jgi:aconitate hydratase|nr:aconitate hydratase AcnA [Pseudorhodoplanes sp.]